MEKSNIPVVVNILFRRYVFLIISATLRDGLCKHGFPIVNATTVKILNIGTCMS